MPLELLLFDMDGTLVCYPESSFQSSWDALGVAAGKKEAWIKNVDYYYPRPELHKEWLQESCKLLKGIPVELTLSKILPPPMPPGTKEFFKYNSQLTPKPIIGIVTSGVDLVAEHIKKEHNIDFIIANEVHTKDGFFTGTGKTNVPLWKKGELVKQIMQKYQILPENTAYFGDNENDKSAWEAVNGLKVAVNPKNPDLKNYVHYVVNDFYEALELLKLK